MAPKRKPTIQFARGYHPPTPNDIKSAIGDFPLHVTRKTEDGRPVDPTSTIPPSISDINMQSYYTCQPCDFRAFKPVPPLTYEGDWLAIVAEEHQPFSVYDTAIRRRSGAFSYVVQGSPTLLDRTTIYLLPVVLDTVGWPIWAPDLEALCEYMSAFFGVHVKVLDQALLSLDLPPERLNSEGKIVTFKAPEGSDISTDRQQLAASVPIHARYNTETTHLQLWMDDIGDALKRIFNSGRYKTAGDVGDAMIIVGVTCEDLYCDGPDSLFTAGLAYCRDKVSILSFARYHPYLRMSGMRWYDYGYAQTATESPYFDDDKKRPAALVSKPLKDLKWKCEFFRRASKLVLHEVGHLFYLMHCTYFHCLMNGTGHLIEDYAAPSHLCPVCLRKLQLRFAFNVIERYKLLQEVLSKNGLKIEATWTQKLLQDLSKSSSPVIILESNATNSTNTSSAAVDCDDSASVEFVNEIKKSRRDMA